MHEVGFSLDILRRPMKWLLTLDVILPLLFKTPSTGILYTSKKVQMDQLKK
jgi:hypothetical protein